MRGFAVLALLASTLPLAAQQSDSSRAVTIDDMFALARVSDPQISPDGQWVAYTVSRTSLKDEESKTRIWMVPASGGKALPMTLADQSAGRPRWSPDGRYLSFLASRGEDAKTQVWLLDRRGGEAQQLTDVKQGVSSYSWSPDGKRLLLTIKDPSVADTASEKPKTRPPHVIDRLQFKRDYAGYLDRRRNHLYVFDLDGHELRQLTFGDYDDGSPVWSPDGSRVAFVSNRTAEPDANDNTDIWVVSLADTAAHPTLQRVTTNPGTDNQPAWSPDGRTIAYTTQLEPKLFWYATAYVATVPAEGGQPHVLRALDRNVYELHFTADGSRIWGLLEDDGANVLARIDPNTGAVDRVIDGDVSVRSYDVGPKGFVAALVSNPTLPSEVFALDGDGAAVGAAARSTHRASPDRRSNLRQLTFTNDSILKTLALSTPRFIKARSKDGTEVHGFLFTPPGYTSGRLPTLLRIHGGPTAQFDWGFMFDAQLFAANGYAVVMMNPRGSTGRGQDYCKAIFADWGNKDFDDVVAGVDRAIQLGVADRDHLGVGGWSYGGILTDHVIVNTDRFKGAITGASEVLYVANYGHDQYQHEWETELGLPWKPAARKVWERISPFNQVEKIHTPTLIMGGDIDWNVPIQNSEQLYEALRRIGAVPTRLVVYPGQHHGIALPTYQKDRLQRYLDWYDRYVKGDLKEPRANWDGRWP
ncbi:MAG: S9 family peptidase [Gemmatimonadota bacterium]